MKLCNLSKKTEIVEIKAEKDERAVFFPYLKIRKVTEKENHRHEEEKRKGATDKESKEIEELSLFEGRIDVNGQ